MKAYARVTMTVEVTLSQPFGDHCMIEDLFSTGKDDAVSRLRIALNSSDEKILIIGEPSVSAVIIPEDKR